MSDQSSKVINYLTELAIPYKRIDHKPLMTMKDVDEVFKDLEAMYCKNLFVRNSKGDKYYLIVIEGHKKVDLKKTARQIRSTRLSFASYDRLKDYLGLKPGSVSPFGLINDEGKSVELLLDKGLREHESVCFHPNINTATLIIKYRDFIKYLDALNYKHQYIECD